MFEEETFVFKTLCVFLDQKMKTDLFEECWGEGVCMSGMWAASGFFSFFCAIFSWLWSILYFTFVMHSGLRRIQILFFVRGASSPGHRCFWIESPPHWLASDSGSQITFHYFFISPPVHC